MEQAGSGWIGRAMPRREDDRLLRGAGRFVDDLRARAADALHLELLRSPHPAGRVTALDVAEARALPGVVAVLTAEDLRLAGASAVNPMLPDAPCLPMPVLASGRVAAVGQPLAAVVAESRAAALEAVELIRCDIAAEAPGAAPPHRAAHWRAGDAAAALDGAANRAAVTLEHALVAPLALEPRAALAEPGPQGLTLWLSTQTPFRARDDLVRMLGLAPEAVRVIAPDVGGAFGAKGSIHPEEVLVALAAHRLGRPVGWTATRSEEFLSAIRGRGMATRAEIGLDAEGRLTGLAARIDAPLGHWMPFAALAPPSNAGRILPGPYAVPALDIAVDLHVRDTPPVGIYRGAGRPEAVMLMERAMDRAAQVAGIDPLDLRRRNLTPPETLGAARPTGTRLDSADLAGLLDRLETATDYAARRAEQARRRAAGEVVGLGLALYVEPCGIGWETARVTLEPDGRLIVDTGSTAQGQGRETAFAQIAADALGCSPADIEVRAGDTDRLPGGIGAVGSRSTGIGGSALLAACETLREEVRAALAATTNEPVTVLPAGFGLGADSLSWPEAAARIGQPVAADARYEAPAEGWASGAILAEVAIDPDTGALTVERLTWADDAGRIVNPMLVEGQMIGGLAQGLGATVMERMVHDAEGQLLTGSLMDYAVPRATDMPRAMTLIAAPVPGRATTLGAKGVGEAGCIGVPAALVNAVQDALAPVTARDLPLPFTPERLWRALQGLEESP